MWYRPPSNTISGAHTSPRLRVSDHTGRAAAAASPSGDDACRTAMPPPCDCAAM
jgi:hypothetical protein